jgi:GNAT superfamily N-acetyltransferase
MSSVSIKPAGEDGPWLNYLGYTEAATEDCYPNAQIDNAWVDDKLAGSIVYGPDEGAMWVYHLYVRPEFRGQGVGSQLMECAVYEAQCDGLQIDGDFTDEAGTLRSYMRSMKVEA